MQGFVFLYHHVNKSFNVRWFQAEARLVGTCYVASRDVEHKLYDIFLLEASSFAQCT